MKRPLLEIKNLDVCYAPGRYALSNVSFSVKEGEILGVVGETGSGKTTVARATLGILPLDVEIDGKVIFKGKDILKTSEVELNTIRGKDIGIIFQEPAASFNPVFSIGYQFEEFLVSKSRARSNRELVSLMVGNLKRCGLADAERILTSYPHQLSGGQLQRVAIAMAISTQPSLLVADEPTSSLDVTVESQIINLLFTLKNEMGLTVLFITHNLALVEVLCDRVVVLYKGEVREIASKEELLSNPEDSYTKELISSFKKIS